MDWIQTDADTQFTSKDFQEGLPVCGVLLTLTAPDHQKINGQVELTWWKLYTIVHSIMVHAWVSDEYMHFLLMYTTHHIFTVFKIKHLINKYDESTMPQKLATGTKPSVSNIRILFFSYVVQKVTAHIDRKALNMRHWSQNGFRGISVVITQQKNG